MLLHLLARRRRLLSFRTQLPSRSSPSPLALADSGGSYPSHPLFSRSFARSIEPNTSSCLSSTKLSIGREQRRRQKQHQKQHQKQQFLQQQQDPRRRQSSSRMATVERVKELRVASQELESGSTAGRVFVRLLPLTAAPASDRPPPPSSSSSTSSSSSAPRSSAKDASPRTLPRLPAAALLADRPVAKARVSRQLRSLIDREAAEDASAASTGPHQQRHQERR
jgi:hypothetical protein